MKKLGFIILFFLSNYVKGQIGNDCFNPILLCDTSSFTIITSGYTSSGTNPPCFSTTVQQDIWFQFTILQAGTIAWNFKPRAAIDEFDWALYDTVGCGIIFPSIQPILCNYNYNAEQGNPFGMDVSACVSCPTTGLDSLPCAEFCLPIMGNVGEVFTIMIDNYSINTDTLDFKWTGTALITCDTLTSVSSTSMDNNTIIFPNPTTGSFYIFFEESSNAIVTIRNVVGGLVWLEKFEDSKEVVVYLDEPAGIYFLQIEADGEIITKKIIKQ